MALEWKEWGYGTWSAMTTEGRYSIQEGQYLAFEPKNGQVVDPDAEGVEYLGKFSDPKAAAQRHSDTGNVEEIF